MIVLKNCVAWTLQHFGRILGAGLGSRDFYLQVPYPPYIGIGISTIANETIAISYQLVLLLLSVVLLLLMMMIGIVLLGGSDVGYGSWINHNGMSFG